MTRAISILNSEKRLAVKRGMIAKMIRVLDSQSQYPLPEGDLNISFLSEVESAALHLRFFHDPSSTDVMTFPGDEEDEHAGDLAICPMIAYEASVRFKSTFAREMTLYLVHACLHLAGLNDHSENEILEMRLAETTLMSLLDESTWESTFSWKSD